MKTGGQRTREKDRETKRTREEDWESQRTREKDRESKRSREEDRETQRKRYEDQETKRTHYGDRETQRTRGDEFRCSKLLKKREVESSKRNSPKPRTDVNVATTRKRQRTHLRWDD